MCDDRNVSCAVGGSKCRADVSDGLLVGRKWCLCSGGIVIRKAEGRKGVTVAGDINDAASDDLWR